MEVKIGSIISLLIDDNNLSEFQMGYNLALIKILKQNYVTENIPTEKEVYEVSLADSFKNVMQKDGRIDLYYTIPNKDIHEILTAIMRNDKVNAVKTLKYAINLGLKECKDIIDQLM